MIQRKLRHQIVLFLITSALVLAVGCSSAQKKTEEPAPEPTTTTPAAPTPAADENATGDSDSGKAMGLQTVHFPFDSSVLDQAAKSALKSDAEILKAHPNVKIQIEGHCDQRGGIQYNIALGERRANIAKKYLEDLGIDGSRISVISFGKEKLIDTGTTEKAYARNRRDNFVITSP